MDAPVAGKIIIKGVTSKGRKFRPSDWAERLVGAFATYGRDRRIHFHPRVSMGRWEDQTCVVVDRRLEQEDPMIYDFILRFARDNDLQTMETAAFPPQQALAGDKTSL
jgi:hypothetical protein